MKTNCKEKEKDAIINSLKSILINAHILTKIYSTILLIKHIADCRSNVKLYDRRNKSRDFASFLAITNLNISYLPKNQYRAPSESEMLNTERFLSRINKDNLFNYFYASIHDAMIISGFDKQTRDEFYNMFYEVVEYNTNNSIDLSYFFEDSLSYMFSLKTYNKNKAEINKHIKKLIKNITYEIMNLNQILNNIKDQKQKYAYQLFTLKLLYKVFEYMTFPSNGNLPYEVFYTKAMKQDYTHHDNIMKKYLSYLDKRELVPILDSIEAIKENFISSFLKDFKEHDKLMYYIKSSNYKRRGYTIIPKTKIYRVYAIFRHVEITHRYYDNEFNYDTYLRPNITCETIFDFDSGLFYFTPVYLTDILFINLLNDNIDLKYFTDASFIRDKHVKEFLDRVSAAFNYTYPTYNTNIPDKISTKFYNMPFRDFSVIYPVNTIGTFGIFKTMPLKPHQLITILSFMHPCALYLPVRELWYAERYIFSFIFLNYFNEPSALYSKYRIYEDDLLSIHPDIRLGDNIFFGFGDIVSFFEIVIMFETLLSLYIKNSLLKSTKFDSMSNNWIDILKRSYIVQEQHKKEVTMKITGLFANILNDKYSEPHFDADSNSNNFSDKFEILKTFIKLLNLETFNIERLKNIFDIKDVESLYAEIEDSIKKYGENKTFNLMNVFYNKIKQSIEMLTHKLLNTEYVIYQVTEGKSKSAINNELSRICDKFAAINQYAVYNTALDIDKICINACGFITKSSFTDKIEEIKTIDISEIENSIIYNLHKKYYQKNNQHVVLWSRRENIPLHIIYYTYVLARMNNVIMSAYLDAYYQDITENAIAKLISGQIEDISVDKKEYIDRANAALDSFICGEMTVFGMFNHIAMIPNLDTSNISYTEIKDVLNRYDEIHAVATKMKEIVDKTKATSPLYSYRFNRYDTLFYPAYVYTNYKENRG